METVSEYPADFDEFTNPPTEVSPMSIIIEFVVHVYPQNSLSLFDFPIIGPKKNCHKLYTWVSNPIRRKIQEQWKKNELNPTYQ